LNRQILKISILFILFLVTASFAQKLGYVESQRVLQNFQEWVDSQNKLQELRDGYQAEYDNMVKQLEQMMADIQSQSLLLSEEKKQQKLKEVQDRQLTIERFKYEKLGPEGEYYKKNLELTKPIIDKINKVIQEIGEREEYDFIIDASSGALLHALPKYDITDQVLEELNKGVSSTSTTQ
jgi:outer membrane protein